MKLLKKALGMAICGVALLLPYRWRIALSDKLGLAINFCYQSYVGMWRWLFRQLHD